MSHPLSKIDDQGRYTIYTRGGATPDTADIAEQALLADMAKGGEHFFRRGRKIVRLAIVPEMMVRGKMTKVEPHIGAIEVTPDYLYEHLTRIASWAKFDERSQKVEEN